MTLLNEKINERLILLFPEGLFRGGAVLLPERRGEG